MLFRDRPQGKSAPSSQIAPTCRFRQGRSAAQGPTEIVRRPVVLSKQEQILAPGPAPPRDPNPAGAPTPARTPATPGSARAPTPTTAGPTPTASMPTPTAAAT